MRRRSEDVQQPLVVVPCPDPMGVEPAPRRRSKKDPLAVDVPPEASNEVDSVVGALPVQVPRLATDLQRIVTSTFTMPAVDEAATRLEEKLHAIRPSRCDYGTIADALDEAQENARLAMQLLVNAKLANDRFIADAQLTESGMRDHVHARLQSEKDRGQRSKAITDADVVAAMANCFPDEWQQIELTKHQARRTIAYLEDLCDRMRERARDLRALVSNARG